MISKNSDALIILPTTKNVGYGMLFVTFNFVRESNKVMRVGSHAEHKFDLAHKM